MKGIGDSGAAIQNGRDDIAQRRSVRAVWMLLLFKLLQYTGAGTAFAFLPEIMTDFFASESTGREVHCSDSTKGRPPDACLDAHTKALGVVAVQDLVSFAVLTVFVSPIIGSWSDTYGRKPFILLGTAAQLIHKILLLAYLQFDVSLYWYFVAAVIFMAFRSNATMMAFVTDSVPAESKLMYFSLFFSMFSAGIFMGSMLVICNVVESQKTAALVNVVGNFLSLALVAVFVPEARRVDLQSPPQPKNTLKASLGLLTQNRLFMCLTVCILAVSLGLVDGSGQVLGQYLQEVANITADDMAIIVALLSGSSLFSPLFIYAFKRLKLRHTSVLMICFAGLAVQYLMLAFATQKVVAFVAVPFMCLAMVVLSTISSMKSDMVPEDQQGALQGAISSVRGLVTGVGPLVFLAVFASFRTNLLYFPGAAMLFVALVQIIGALFACKIGTYLSGGHFESSIEIPVRVDYKPVATEEAA